MVFTGHLTDLIFESLVVDFFSPCLDLKHSPGVGEGLDCHIIVCFDTKVSKSERIRTGSPETSMKVSYIELDKCSQMVLVLSMRVFVLD